MEGKPICQCINPRYGNMTYCIDGAYMYLLHGNTLVIVRIAVSSRVSDNGFATNVV